MTEVEAGRLVGVRGIHEGVMRKRKRQEAIA